MSAKSYLGGKVVVHGGDCLDVLRSMESCSVDSVVTDPPYALVSIGKRFGADGAAPPKDYGGSGVYQRASAGFMGKQWDTGERAFTIELWAEVLRVLKPGGHMLAFGGTRTVHRLACAIEDAGFEIRDQIGFAFGSGFPKSHSVSRDKRFCQCASPCERVERNAVRTDPGLGEAAHNGTAGLSALLAADVASPNVRIATGRPQGFQADCLTDHHSCDGRPPKGATPAQASARQSVDALEHNRFGEPDDAQQRAPSSTRPLNDVRRATSDLPLPYSDAEAQRSIADGTLPRSGGTGLDTAQPETSTQNSDGQSLAWPQCSTCGKPIANGFGTALKPAWEPIVLARKPLSEGTVAGNVLKHGTGAINVDGCRVPGEVPSVPQPAFNSPTGKIYGFKAGEGRNGEMSSAPLGRWPANLIHDGSDEVVRAFPETATGFRAKQSTANPNDDGRVIYGKGLGRQGVKPFNDTGSAARFFYSARPDHRCALCDALIAEASSPTGNIQTENSVRPDAPVSPSRGNGGSESPSNGYASNVARPFELCPQPICGSAPESAPPWPLERIAQNVKSAAILCDSCGTAIALALAEARQRRSLGSLQFPGSISEHNAQILWRHLALYVAGREDTDTILTTASLKMLLGSVFHAIANTTDQNEAKPKESVARFWYSSKAGSDDRLGSSHPTIKPLDLIQYLIRLVTQPGGICLDPFAGTGTTGEAAFREGMRAILIEREPEYLADIERRMKLVLAGADERKHATIKARGKTEHAGPLFAVPEAAE